MKLSELPKTTEKSQKRIGRGHGSGKGGHTSTRGSKGQKSRTKVGLFFEGTKFKKSLLKRLPFMRGKGKFNPQEPPSVVINLKYLNFFEKGDEVTLVSLQSKGILGKDLPGNTKVKILGNGEINIPLSVFLPASKGAKEKIEKAGGTVGPASAKATAGKEVRSEKETVKIEEPKEEKKEVKKARVVKKSVKKKIISKIDEEK